VKSKGGREFWKVDQVNADVSHVWLCPYSKTLAAATPAMRLENEGVTYEILSVIDIDLAHKEVEIQTKRAV
jgi:SPP1 family predicted phage head-tail adaptor